jgi:hypothetical protein
VLLTKGFWLVELNEFGPDQIYSGVVPLVPPEAFRLRDVPAQMVTLLVTATGGVGSDKVFELASVPLQPVFVTEK